MDKEEAKLWLDSFPYTVIQTIAILLKAKATRQQVQLAKELQEAHDHEINTIIEKFRGLGKSLITSIFAMWCLSRNRQLKILIISGSSSKAKNFVRFCFMLMHKVEFFSYLKQRGRSGERRSIDSFDVKGAEPAQDPSVKSIGIEGTITSARANIIIVDDMETKINSRTVGGREFLFETSTEFEALLTAGAKQFVVYLGTRHHRESVYHRIRNDRGYRHIVTPVYYPASKKEIDEYIVINQDTGEKSNILSPSLLHDLDNNPSLFGEPTDERFDKEEIRKKMLGMGKTAFSMQMLLKVDSSKDFYPFSLDDILITNLPRNTALENIIIGDTPKHSEVIRGMRADDTYNWYRDIGYAVPCGTVIMAIDPSGRGKDLFSYSIVGSMYGRFWVYDIGGFTGGYKDDNLKRVLYLCRDWGVREIVIEDNFGDGTVRALMTRVMKDIHIHIGITGIQNNKNKVLRIIDTLEPIFNQHRIIFNEEVIYNSNRIALEFGEEYSFIHQLANIVKDKDLEHDDMIDSFEMAITALLKTIDVHPNKAIKSAQFNRFRDEVEARKIMKDYERAVKKRGEN